MVKEYPIIWFEEDSNGGWTQQMTKLNLNNLKFEGHGIPESDEALQDEINDLAKSCKKDSVKALTPKSPTPFTEIVNILKDKHLIASNEPSDNEDDDIRDQRKKHKEDVSKTKFKRK